jgi:hypothetical protein
VSTFTGDSRRIEKAVGMGWRRMLAAAIAVGSTLVVAPAAMASAPVVTASDPVNLDSTSATLFGTVTPGAEATDYHFEWDVASSDFCKGVPLAVAANSVGDGTLAGSAGPTGVTQPLVGLVAMSSYCYRIVAANFSGTARSPIRAFKTPPETNLWGRPSGIVTRRYVEMSFNSGADAFECSFDGSAWADCGSPTVLTDLADGSHTFKVRAVDDTDPAHPLADPSPAVSTFRVSVPTTAGGGTTGGGAGTVPAGPTGPATAPVAAAPKVARAGRAKLKGAKLSTGQKVSCAGAGDACRVTVKLSASAKGGKKLVSVGSTRLTVAAGGSRTITVKLNAKGRKLLKKARKLKVFSLVTVRRGVRIPVTSGLKFNVRK